MMLRCIIAVTVSGICASAVLMSQSESRPAQPTFSILINQKYGIAGRQPRLQAARFDCYASSLEECVKEAGATFCPTGETFEVIREQLPVQEHDAVKFGYRCTVPKTAMRTD